MASAFIGLLEIEMLIQGAASLKEKRRVLRSLKDQIQHRYNVSIAEVGYQDLHQRSHLAVVAVGSDKANVQKRLVQVESVIESHPDVQVTDRLVQWL